MTLHKDSTVYISIDIEANGNSPISESLLSFAAVAIDRDENILGTDSHNLKTLPGHGTSPGTDDFWKQNIHAYMATREDQEEPLDAMRQHQAWLFKMKKDKKLVVMGYPLSYDWLWYYSYYTHFNGNFNPIGFAGLDLKLLAAEKLGVHFKDAVKVNFPKEWFKEGLPHTHIALDDAMEQAFMGIRILNYNTDSKG